MILKRLFYPEKSTALLKLFHKSSYTLLPIGLASYCLFPMEEQTIFSSAIHSMNVINFGFHSYVSTSFVLSDYIKPPVLQKSLRFASLNAHTLAAAGFLHYFFKKYKQ